MKRLMSCCILLLAAWVPWAPASAAEPQTDYPLLASIRPIALLVQELTESLPVRVDTLIPAGATTHDYALSPSDLGRMRQARLVVWLGPASEPYLRRVLNNPAAEVRWADLPELVKLPTRSAMHQQGHDHEGDGHQHHHSGGIDPHIWWSVPNAILLARTLEQRISRDRPDWSVTLQNNRQQLETRLNRQLQEQRARFATGFKPFLLAHDAFFYLEEDLGIASEAALVLDPENKPGVKHLLALQRRVAEQNVGCVITGALVPASLIDKIDTRPPLLRLALDELGWDSPGQRYSDWLAQAYVKVAECVGLSAS